ncbi:MAG: choice-of-anchor D domain-containing protein [Prevotellaceae bacterium]|jgi:hypothetical protein|nr:choice-of-anchor D domain-containing protein [Prevotellaceae bacterium]
MKKISILVICIFTILPLVNAQIELLDNSDLDEWESGFPLEKPVCWNVVGHSREQSIVHSGASAVRITAGNTNIATINQQISLSSSYQAGAMYEMRFWYYVVSSPGGNGDVIVNSQWTGSNVDSNWNSDVLTDTFHAEAVGQWEEKVIPVSMQMSPTPSSLSFNFSLKAPKNAVVIFDDLSFKKVENSSSTEPSLTVLPARLTAVSTVVGTPVNFQEITVTTDNLPYDVDIYLTGADPQYFTPSITQIPAGQTSTTLTVTYLPTQSGNHSAVLSFDCTSAPWLFESRSISGTAGNANEQPQIFASPNTVNFGTVQVGEQLSSTVYVGSLGLSDYLYISITPDANSAGQFLLGNSLFPKNLTNMPLSVTFKPTREGSFSAQVRLYSPGATDVLISVTGNGTGTISQEQEGDALPLSTENALSLMNESFGNVISNKPLSIEGWKNIAEKNYRAWWGYNHADNNKSAKVTAYNSINTAPDEYEMWLYTHALDYPNATTKEFTFKVMGNLLLDSDPSVLELYYVSLNDDGTMYRELILGGEQFPSIADENNIWQTYNISLDNQPIDDLFFMAFRYYCPQGGAFSSQIYYIDDVTWGDNLSSATAVETRETKIWSANGEIHYYTNENQQIAVFDINGKKAGDFLLKTGRNTLPAHFANGIYFVTNYKNINKKIIIK